MNSSIGKSNTDFWPSIEENKGLIKFWQEIPQPNCVICGEISISVEYTGAPKVACLWSGMPHIQEDGEKG